MFMMAANAGCAKTTKIAAAVNANVNTRRISLISYSSGLLVGMLRPRIEFLED